MSHQRKKNPPAADWGLAVGKKSDGICDKALSHVVVEPRLPAFSERTQSRKYVGIDPHVQNFAFRLPEGRLRYQMARLHLRKLFVGQDGTVRKIRVREIPSIFQLFF